VVRSGQLDLRRSRCATPSIASATRCGELEDCQVSEWMEWDSSTGPAARVRRSGTARCTRALASAASHARTTYLRPLAANRNPVAKSRAKPVRDPPGACPRSTAAPCQQSRQRRVEQLPSVGGEGCEEALIHSAMLGLQW
jgi:hypothetical protein